jgi:hypothetical protein
MNKDKKIKKATKLLHDRLLKIRSRIPIEEQYEWCPDYTEEEQEEMDFLEKVLDVLELE